MEQKAKRKIAWAKCFEMAQASDGGTCSASESILLAAACRCADLGCNAETRLLLDLHSKDLATAKMDPVASKQYRMEKWFSMFQPTTDDNPVETADRDAKWYNTAASRLQEATTYVERAKESKSRWQKEAQSIEKRAREASESGRTPDKVEATAPWPPQPPAEPTSAEAAAGPSPKPNRPMEATRPYAGMWKQHN